MSSSRVPQGTATTYVCCALPACAQGLFSFGLGGEGGGEADTGQNPPVHKDLALNVACLCRLSPWVTSSYSLSTRLRRGGIGSQRKKLAVLSRVAVGFSLFAFPSCFSSGFVLLFCTVSACFSFFFCFPCTVPPFFDDGGYKRDAAAACFSAGCGRPVFVL